MRLRKGKTKTTLESSIDAALLAVEVYNKPRTAFRSEAYIAMMVIAWTRLFHAYFNATIGDKYYYKKNNRYERIDGERKAWELSTCIAEYEKLKEPVKKNLEFFVKLRNKIEHRHIDKREVDILIFGECQALLYNFENTLIDLFGEQYALNESLVYTLQFSHLRTPEQNSASKVALSKDLKNVRSYVEQYRSSLSQTVFDSQEYSIKLLQIPKISNTNRSELAVEFVRWDDLNEEDREAFEKVAAIIKDKRIRIEGINVGKLKRDDVVRRVEKALPGTKFSRHTHTCLFHLLSIRPPSKAEDPFDTNPVYCHYDEAHGDYLYREEWPNLIIDLLQSGRIEVEEIHAAKQNNEQWNIDELTA